jgi:hypothetical protein
LPDYLQFYLPSGGDSPFQEIPPIGIYINTNSSPFRVFGQSVQNDGSSGDLFTILPISALGKNYVVALNAQTVPNTSFLSRVQVVITEDNTTVSFATGLQRVGTVFQLSSVGSFVSSFSADKRLAVTAGTECFGFGQGQCDYRAIMPLPTRCGNNQGDLDTHPVLNLQSTPNTYIIAAECGTGSSFQVDGGQGGQLDNAPVFNYQFSPSGINETHIISVGDPQKPIQVTFKY